MAMYTMGEAGLHGAVALDVSGHFFGDVRDHKVIESLGTGGIGLSLHRAGGYRAEPAQGRGV